MDFAAHSPYTDPREHAALLREVPAEPAAISQVVRNVVAHYRAQSADLPSETVDDINLRWLDKILAAAQQRQSGPLERPRAMADHVQGCCRDHTLLAVAILREHGVPARSRVGFTNYFVPGWHHDHVVPEYFDGRRWVRFEPEIDATELLPDPLDLPRDIDPATGVGFVPAAGVWQAHRAGRIDPERFGVDESVPQPRGEWFIREYVICELAHRFGDEVLLWDVWEAMEGPNSTGENDELIDRIAGLIVASDAGDEAAEVDLEELYRSDARLRPWPEVQRVDPLGSPAVTESLQR